MFLFQCVVTTHVLHGDSPCVLDFLVCALCFVVHLLKVVYIFQISPIKNNSINRFIVGPYPQHLLTLSMVCVACVGGSVA